MIKYLAGAATASGDTVKTSLGTITLPAGATKIIGAWCMAHGGAGDTTLENVSGILELESPDVNLQPCQIPLEPLAILTSGMASIPNKVWPMNVPVTTGVRVTGYVTMDQALAINPSVRFGLVVEV